MAVRVEKVVTSGTFALDGGEWDVDNNVWLVGDDDEVLVIDAAHDADAILAAVGDRRVVAVVLHPRPQRPRQRRGRGGRGEGRRDRAAPGGPRCCGTQEYGRPAPGHRRWPTASACEVAGTRLAVLHTPGHSPGAVCLYAPDLGAVFSGDTLFRGGPGATGRSYSDFDRSSSRSATAC